MSGKDDLLAFAHIGDLHLTERDRDNAKDFQAIIAQLRQMDELDFVFLPGDNADKGEPDQYALVREGMEALDRPVHIITGDHDMESGSLDAFYTTLDAPGLPYAVDQSGIRCLFLDMCGPGKGGLDFRLGAEQRAWLEHELMAADKAEISCALFMHSYPADLRGEGEAQAVAALVARSPVRLVEMGHTHYNELANDGHTIFAATRSTGQIEEGDVGYALVAIDRKVVSWRFKPLATPWPFVMITAPSDRRLALDEGNEEHVVGETFEVRALVFGMARIDTCACRVDDGPWLPMSRVEGDRRYRVELPWPSDATTLSVRAIDVAGGEDIDGIEPATGKGWSRPIAKGSGSDADRVGAWPEKGLLGTQLGPNRNGMQW